MDGNFISRYEKKIDEILESGGDLVDYLMDCMPYVQKYYGHDEDPQRSEVLFNTTIQRGVQKKEIFNNYLRNVEKYEGELEPVTHKKKTVIDLCKGCSSSNLFLDSRTSELVCRVCGVCEYFPREELTYKEEQEQTEKVVTYSYKRDNHFNEWILQFQAQEHTNIPHDVIAQLRSEFRKQKIIRLSDITHAKVRLLLKKLKLNKYYEHVPYITTVLNGVEPPKMSQELEDKLRQMFREIQDPFDKHCPENRKNFLSYSYVLYKFCELLGEDDFLACFPLLKAKDKLYQQDVIWKLICTELRWEFIPTI